MSLYTALISGVVFPLQESFKHHTTVRVRKEMEQSQYWPLQQLEALRAARLKALLTHAGEHVPYYRDLFARLGFKLRSVRGSVDLQNPTLLDKIVICANSRFTLGSTRNRRRSVSNYRTIYGAELGRKF